MSGKELPPPHEKQSKYESMKIGKESELSGKEKQVVDQKDVIKGNEKEEFKLSKNQPRLPYLAKVKQNQQDEQFKKFLDLSKMLHINIPFVESFVQMPHYVKFLKELLMDKRKLEDVSMMTLSEECLAILTKKLPKKEKDLGSFVIPCTIGGVVDEKVLADQGVSINLIPYKFFQRLGLGDPQPMKMTLQLAYRSIRYPRGIIEDVL